MERRALEGRQNRKCSVALPGLALFGKFTGGSASLYPRLGSLPPSGGLPETTRFAGGAFIDTYDTSLNRRINGRRVLELCTAKHRVFTHRGCKSMRGRQLASRCWNETISSWEGGLQALEQMSGWSRSREHRVYRGLKLVRGHPDSEAPIG
jgi:hypothetical protein